MILLALFILSSRFAIALETLPDADIQFNDKNGRIYSLNDLLKKPTLVFFEGQGCPISDKAKSKIDAIDLKYGDKFNIVRIELNSEIKLAKDLKSRQIFVLDKFKILANYFKPPTMSYSYLIADNKILYRGSIDNQFTLFNSKEENIKNFLVDAIAEYLQSKPVSLPETESSGCLVDFKSKSTAMSFGYFKKNVAPIIENRCILCHNAALDFSKYENLSNFKEMIGYVVKEDIMPPWAPEGHNWKDSTKLKDSEKKEILKWVNSNDTEIIQRSRELLLKKPQQSEVLNAAYEKLEILAGKTTVEANPSNEYRYFKFSLNNKEPMWIDYVEFKSSNAYSLHHATIVVRNVEFDDAQKGFHNEAPRMLVGTTGIWKHYRFANNSNTGFYIPAHSFFYIEAHYKGSGHEISEELKVNIYKFKKKPKKGLFTVALLVPHSEISIPPNTKNVCVEKEQNMMLDKDVSIVAVNAHMHARGDKILFQLLNSKAVDILRINKYRYKTQQAYFLKEPLLVKKGNKVKFKACYDNTSDNLSNPDPEAFVSGGESSKEEMAVGTIWLSGDASFVQQLMKNYIFK